MSFSLSDETTKKIYHEYIKESLIIFQNIYKEVLGYIKNEEFTDSELKDSTLNIQSWAGTLNKNTNSLGEFIATSSWNMSYVIEPESWREDLYVEITEKNFFSSSFIIEIVPDFPRENFHLISLNDRGVIFSHAIETTQPNTIHTISLMKGVRLAFTNRLIDIIKTENNFKGTIEVFAPSFLGTNTQFFIPRLPFEPHSIHLTQLTWILSVLNSIDTLMKKTYFFSVSYIDVETNSTPNTNNVSQHLSFVRKHIPYTSTNHSSFMFAPTLKK